MQLTEHYGLKKPLDYETAEIQDIRDNMDLIDAALFSLLPKALKGAANGVASLGSDGKVPSAQLPSYVDDVLEYAMLASFPATGEAGKIYVAQDSNKTYRWSGSAYTEISASLALGETSATAYPGDKGKAAYTHSQATGNPHGTTAAQVGAYTKDEVYSKDEVDSMVKNALLRDLNFYLKQSLNTSNIDAWADLLNDATMLDASSNGHTVSGGQLVTAGKVAFQTGTTYVDKAMMGSDASAWAYITYDFVAEQTGKLKDIVLTVAWANGVPIDGIYVKITGSTGMSATSNIISGSSLTGTATATTFTFPISPTIEAGILYTITVKRTGDYQSKYYAISCTNGTLKTYSQSGTFYCDRAYKPITTVNITAPATVVWKGVNTSDFLKKVCVAAEVTGNVAFSVSCDKVTWVNVAALNTAQAVAFAAKLLYLKAVLQPGAAITGVAWGGF